MGNNFTDATPASGSAVDTSTSALIAALDAAIAGNTAGIQSIEIRGRKIVNMQPTELLKARGMLLARQHRETHGMFFVGRPRRT